MIDLEAAGNGSKSALLSIGAVLFDPITGETGAEFYQPVLLASSSYYGDMDAPTIEWWMKQPEEARAVFGEEGRITLKESLIVFADWLNEHITDEANRIVWGNGPAYDNVNLANAYKETRLTLPWRYSNDRCVRTMVDLGRRLCNIDPKHDIKIEGTAHNALDDAKHQAAYVSVITQKLAGS